jgi:hypothetical protein
MVAGADFSGSMPADVVTLAALIGGCLSLAAAIGLAASARAGVFHDIASGGSP